MTDKPDNRDMEAPQTRNWRLRWRWPVRTLFLGTVGAAFVFLAGFVAFADYISRMRTPATTADADGIVVLTGGEARLTTAAQLLQEHKGRRLLITGVNPRASRESLQAYIGVTKALFDCCVDIDNAADTIGNAEETAKWISMRGYDEVIVVTNNYHMPRSLLEMKRYVSDVELVPYPVVNTDLGDGNWLRRPQAVRVLFTEYVKFIAAASRTMLPARRQSGVTTAVAAQK